MLHVELRSGPELGVVNLQIRYAESAPYYSLPYHHLIQKHVLLSEEEALSF